MSRTYITNELGDVYQVDEDGTRSPVDPTQWGWVKEGGVHDHADMRRSIDSLRALPGFVVEERPDVRYDPGPKQWGSSWGRFEDGSAPPAAVQSKDGHGTLGYLNRLSEAVGHVASRLPVDPSRSPMLIHDFIGGRLFRVTYSPPLPTATGFGTVYVLEDGSESRSGTHEWPSRQARRRATDGQLTPHHTHRRDEQGHTRA
jgi:hypothetical protein